MNCELKESKKRYRFIQALVDPDTHKALRRLALDQDTTLADLIQEIVNTFLKESKWQSQVILKLKEIDK